MSIYSFEVEKIDQSKQSLKEFAGDVIVIVNTASKCGLTPQFAGLEELYKKYHEQGLTILGFPCNQFMRQDPKSNEDILEFCQLNYGVTFPMFAKIAVKGKNQAPLYQYLVEETNGKKIEWNFAKFLIDRQGKVVKRFDAKQQPAELEKDIISLL